MADSDRSERLRHLSPAKRAALLRQALQPEPERASTIPRLPRPGPYELSFAQQRLWFLDQAAPGSSAYNVPFGMRLVGPLDRAALAAALAGIVRRHEVLRSTFALAGERPVQVVGLPCPFDLPVTDLRGLGTGRRREEVRHLCLEEARRPFDLARGPVVRASLLRLGDDEHVVQLTMHHIVCDGWSDAILRREIAVLYNAFSAGLPSPLPDLPIQYSDFAAWQRQELSGERLEQLVSHWKRQLAGAPGTLELPADRPRPPVRRARGERLPFSLVPALAADLSELGRSRRATLFMVLLAGLDALLFRLSGQSDLVVGTPVARRDRIETEDLIGLFINTLALRATLGEGASFQDLLAEVQRTTLAAFAHQDLPFEKLVEELRLERSESHTPVFQVMLAFQTAARRTEGPDGGGGLAVQGLPLATGTAKFDLTFELAAWPGGGIQGSVEYDADVFDATSVRRWLSHFESLLQQAVADPGRGIAELPLLGEAERHQLREWSARRSFPARLCLHQLFERWAALQPGAIAVTAGDQALSYRELDLLADRLAWSLRRRGVGPESLVGLCLERSLDVVAGILGVLKAGGGYVPLEPGLPTERLKGMIEDARVSLLLAQRETAADLPECGVPVLLLDDLPRVPPEEPAEWLPVAVPPDATAYVIFTSGSTGRPKGVRVTHANVMALLAAAEEWFDFGAADVWSIFHAFSFDFSVWELWGALAQGGRAVLVSWEVSRSPELFWDLLVREKVTVLNQTPSAFGRLLVADRAAGEGELALRWIIFGGEALNPGMLRPWPALPGGASTTLVNMYGITETTVHVTYRRLSPADVERPGSRIGSPLPHLAIHLLDAGGLPVPVGVAGEICVGGQGLAREYAGLPGLTAERFVPDPFADEPGARLYHSGDLARFHADGDLEYLGRIDQQVKIRGFRIELGEIEAALRRDARIQEAVVAAVGEMSERRLVAYLVPAPGNEPDIGELRLSLLAQLPAYMVPALFAVLEALPHTASGKIDRRRLPAPDPDRHVLRREYLSPGTPVEKTLAEIWARVLGLDRVGLGDNFFALGGDSMNSLQVVSRAREHGVPLSVPEMFRHPTLRELAAAVAATASSLETAAGSGEEADDLLAELLADVEGLSEESTRQLLLSRLGTIVEEPEHE